MGMKVNDDPAAFKEIDDKFKEVKDKSGTSMLEIAKQYWTDPDFAERQRQEIAEKKRRRGR
jgi:hypothetical protein